MEKNFLEGRVAVVTGSGQGVGRAIAIGLAQAGAAVVTNNRRKGSTGSAMVTTEQFEALPEDRKEWFRRAEAETKGDAGTTAEEICRRGGRAVPCFADISRFDDARRLIETAVETYGRIDILVNVAGAFGICDIDEISEELWDRVNSIKPKGYFHTMRFAIPYMKQQKYGRIINCTSRAFMGDVIKHAEYCAANAGVVGLTRGAAMELRSYGITCNAFGPFARTRAAYEMETMSLSEQKGIFAEGQRLEAPRYEDTPLPEKVVPFVLYLASEYSGEVSGSVFTLSGNAIQMHREPIVEKMMVKEGAAPWTVEEIVREAPRCILKDYHSIAD